MKTESIFFAVLMAVNALGAALPEAAIVRDGLTNSRIVFETTGKGVVAFLGGSITARF